MTDNDESNKDSLDIDALRKRIKKELKVELLEEVRRELKFEEKAAKVDKPEIDEKAETIELTREAPAPIAPVKAKEPAPTAPVKTKENIIVSITPILKIASHAYKYANPSIPKNKWVEVIGLLAGALDANGHTLYLEDAYPMGHGTTVYAEIKDYKNYVRAYKDIKKKNFFICGWYHSHPSYGLFMSKEDFGTQVRYQKLWKGSIALVIDPYLIDGASYGFKIFRAKLRSKEWYPIPFSVKGSFVPSNLPELLGFIHPIVHGKALYLEYDED
ncbi:MAG: hypothetical protein HWN66_13640 [Candidatus Helarchaeota archaeon]|nr:hypothetical protein [Candidatus Helarchaeota archaeon]